MLNLIDNFKTFLPLQLDFLCLMTFKFIYIFKMFSIDSHIVSIIFPKPMNYVLDKLFLYTVKCICIVTLLPSKQHWSPIFIQYFLFSKQIFIYLHIQLSIHLIILSSSFFFKGSLLRYKQEKLVKKDCTLPCEGIWREPFYLPWKSPFNVLAFNIY